MDLKSPAEKRIEDFLDRQLSWVRKALHGQPLSWEEMSALQQAGGFETLGQAWDEYLQLLQQCPARLRGRTGRGAAGRRRREKQSERL